MCVVVSLARCCLNQLEAVDKPLSEAIGELHVQEHLPLHRYGSAESDCSLALTLDGSYLKAFLRRGTARLKLGRPEEAREDFQSALKLEPGNKLARAELDKLNKVCDTSFPA